MLRKILPNISASGYLLLVINTIQFLKIICIKMYTLSLIHYQQKSMHVKATLLSSLTTHSKFLEGPNSQSKD